MSGTAEYDVVIRGGRVVDGTRMPSFIGDVAIKDGKVVETGSVQGKGRKEIDAKGLIVAPGFVDNHTHYDAQLNWDPYASQSCWHGITTVVISLCGFGFAPCRPEDRERAMRRMTRVEAIPYEAMKLGMRWDWVTQDEFLTSFERAGVGVNVAAYIPHSAIRAYVLGAEDNKRVDPTPSELEQMKELVRDGYRAGALGLSTDQNLIDRDYDGSMLPSTIARPAELEALVSVAREFNVGSIEVTPANMHIGQDEITLLKRFAELSGRPVIHNTLIESAHLPGAWKRSLDLIEEANKQYRIYATAVIHGIGSLFNLIEYNLFDDMPAWNKALACPLEERIRNLKDPAVRQTLANDVEHHLNRVWSGRWNRMRVNQSEHASYVGRLISEIAEAQGKTPLDAFCDIAVSESLRTTFYIEDQINSDDVANAAIVANPYVIPGASDGGAHTQFLSMGKYPTVMLSKWVRDEKVMSLEEAHWRLSHMAAASIGIDGLGTLEPGMPADIVIYDLAKLAVTPDEPYFEPVLGGGKRLVEKAVGYRWILVNGVVTFKDGECTNALPGRVLRTSAYRASPTTTTIAPNLKASPSASRELV
jgi:N-acyl-D-amino-acid deacylase